LSAAQPKLAGYLCGLLRLMHSKLKWQSWVFVSGVVMLGVKMYAWKQTGSNSVMAVALESTVNIIAGAFGLYSLWLALQPRDQNHPYGYGKIEFVAAGLEGGLIILSAVVVGYKAVDGFFHQQVLTQLDVGILLVGATGMFHAVFGYSLVLQGRVQNSPVLTSSGRHLMSDAYTSLGLVVGLLVVWLTGFWYIDNIVALLMALLIGRMGLHTLKSSVGGILDEADRSVLIPLIAHIDELRQPDWIDLHNLRAIRYGDALHIDCHLTLPWFYDQRESHAVVKRFEDAARGFQEAQMELFVHTDPCEPFSCVLCSMGHCAARRSAQTETVRWTLDNVLPNNKHTIHTADALNN